MNRPQPQQVLTDALDLLRASGWCQGMLYTDDGKHCAVGAVVNSLPFLSRGLLHAPLTCLGAVIAQEYPERLDSPESLEALCWASEGHRMTVLFNNHPETSFPDVERVFEKAIANATP